MGGAASSWNCNCANRAIESEILLPSSSSNNRNTATPNNQQNELSTAVNQQAKEHMEIIQESEEIEGSKEEQKEDIIEPYTHNDLLKQSTSVDHIQMNIIDDKLCLGGVKLASGNNDKDNNNLSYSSPEDDIIINELEQPSMTRDHHHHDKQYNNDVLINQSNHTLLLLPEGEKSERKDNNDNDSDKSGNYNLTPKERKSCGLMWKSFDEMKNSRQYFEKCEEEINVSKKFEDEPSMNLLNFRISQENNIESLPLEENNKNDQEEKKDSHKDLNNKKNDDIEKDADIELSTIEMAIESELQRVDEKNKNIEENKRYDHGIERYTHKEKCNENKCKANKQLIETVKTNDKEKNDLCKQEEEEHVNDRSDDEGYEIKSNKNSLNQKDNDYENDNNTSDINKEKQENFETERDNENEVITHKNKAENDNHNNKSIESNEENKLSFDLQMSVMNQPKHNHKTDVDNKFFNEISEIQKDLSREYNPHNHPDNLSKNISPFNNNNPKAPNNIIISNQIITSSSKGSIKSPFIYYPNQPNIIKTTNSNNNKDQPSSNRITSTAGDYQGTCKTIENEDLKKLQAYNNPEDFEVIEPISPSKNTNNQITEEKTIIKTYETCLLSQQTYFSINKAYDNNIINTSPNRNNNHDQIRSKINQLNLYSDSSDINRNNNKSLTVYSIERAFEALNILGQPSQRDIHNLSNCNTKRFDLDYTSTVREEEFSLLNIPNPISQSVIQYQSPPEFTKETHTTNDQYTEGGYTQHNQTNINIPIKRFVKVTKMKSKHKTFLDVNLSINSKGTHFLDEIIFHSKLNKITIHDPRTYTPYHIPKTVHRFCYITSKEFKCFISKEQSITLQKPLSIIPLDIIEKADIAQLPNIKLPNCFSITLNLQHKSTQEPIEEIIIFQAEKREIMEKWIGVINYFLNNNSN